MERELQKDDKKLFTRLKLCRRIPFPFLALRTENFAFSLVQKMASYITGYKAIVYTHLHAETAKYLISFGAAI
jgi:hypothetical protein